jgi:hypothetical protein
MKTLKASELVHSQSKREAQDLKGCQDILNESRRRFNELLGPLAEKLCELYDTSRKEEIKPTLSEILTEGSKRIDDAVEAVIAKHEKEIEYIKAKAGKEPACNDQSLGRELARAAIINMGYDRQQYINPAMAQAQYQNQLYQEIGSFQRDAMNQAHGHFGRWI